MVQVQSELNIADTREENLCLQEISKLIHGLYYEIASAVLEHPLNTEYWATTPFGSRVILDIPGVAW